MRSTIATTPARAHLRPWPADASIRNLVLVDVNMTPSAADIDTWVADAFDSIGDDHAITTIRTGALFPDAAAPFIARGFTEVDRLALFELALTARPTRRIHHIADRSETSVVKLRPRDMATAASIDALAFEPEWANTATSLTDIAAATPRSRQRLACIEGQPVGFAITGRAGPVGYLQRLAVRPDARRRGVAEHLVDDATQWLTRRGATRVVVNTGIANIAALALYEHLGFTRLADELVVLDLARDV